MPPVFHSQFLTFSNTLTLHVKNYKYKQYSVVLIHIAEVLIWKGNLIVFANHARNMGIYT